MDCPNCGKPVSPDQAFCGECGARLETQPVPVAPQPPVPVAPPASAAAAEPAAPPAAAPTQPMPQQPAAAPAYNDAAYQQQYAQQPYQQQYAQPGYQQPYVQQPQPKKKTGLIVGIIAVVAVVVIGAVVGGILLLRSMSGGSETPPSGSAGTVTPPSGGDISDASGFATPEDALSDVYPSDWAFKLQSDDGDMRTYWVGPPNSEFTDEVVLEQADGSWTIVETIPIGMSDVSEDGTPEDEAVTTVMDFLDLIMQDRPLEAQQLCIPPFSEDPASASYSNGDFLGYEILDVTAQEDMTFWVHTAEEWRWGTDEYEYYVVPTELGYYISDVKPFGY